MNKKTFVIICAALGSIAGIIAIVDIFMVISYYNWSSKLSHAKEEVGQIAIDREAEPEEKLQPDFTEDIEDDIANENETDTLPMQKSLRVVCWGDSLTEGTKGGDWSYPKGIKDAAQNSGLDIEVLNYGVYAEESSLICARSGGNPMYLDSSVTVPGDSNKEVAMRLKSKMRGDEMLLVFGGAKDLSARSVAFIGDDSINPCRFTGVDGSIIEGYLRCDPDDGTKYFRRSESVADDVKISAGEKVSFKAMYDSKDSDILVIWTGNNDSLNKSNVYDKTIKYINEIILYTYFGPDSDKTIEDAKDKPYLVLNLSQIDQVQNIDDVNAHLAEAYQGHILDIRSFLLCDALEAVGLNAIEEEDKDKIRNGSFEEAILSDLTDEDKENLHKGKMPASLYAGDGVHFTPECYKAVGYRIYKELEEKGYLTR